jgi:hypothetical protein
MRILAALVFALSAVRAPDVMPQEDSEPATVMYRIVGCSSEGAWSSSTSPTDKFSIGG